MKMKLTRQWLEKHEACPEGIAWFLEQEETDFFKLVKRAKKDGHLDWLNWAIARNLKKLDKIRYAVFAAKQVLHIFEEKFPDDQRPRQAIEAAEKYLKNPSRKNKAAAYAAAHAAGDAAGDAAGAAVWAAGAAADAAYAAYAAAHTADAAAHTADAAAHTADAAAWAVRVAAWAVRVAARTKMMDKITRYGLKLLKGSM